MKQSDKEDLMKSLQRSSISGTAIISFALSFFVLRLAGLDFAVSVILSIVISSLITYAKSRSEL